MALEKERPNMSNAVKEFIYEDTKYQIDSSGKVANGGDLDENNKIILIDKDVPEKFHAGIAVHEIEERKLLKKGHSYVYSHNEAQKKELEFYEKVFGKDKGLQTLEEEEAIILTITRRYSLPKKSKILKTEKEIPEASTNAPLIEIHPSWEVIFEGKRYIIDHSEKLIGTLVDVYERGRIIYIDRDIPERFFEGLALSELVTRKFLKKGMSLVDSATEGSKAEEEYYITKYGIVEATELLNDELRFQAWKFATEKKDLKLENGGHKVIYEKGEILPK